jgi:hypothetical protein
MEFTTLLHLKFSFKVADLDLNRLNLPIDLNWKSSKFTTTVKLLLNMNQNTVFVEPHH